MADNREKDQGLRQGTGGQGMGQSGGQHAPARNPQDDRSAGGKDDQQKGNVGGQKGNPGGQQGGMKKPDGGQNEQTQR